MHLPLLQDDSKIHTVQKLLPFNMWHCPCYQSPLSFTGFIPISDVQSILYFILYKADQYPTSRNIQRPPLPGLVIEDVIIGLFFLPRKMFISQAVLQRDTIHCSCPIQGNLHSLSPQALSAAHAGNKCQNKSTSQAPSRNFQERKYCCGLKAVFFFLMLTFKKLQQSRAVAAAVLVSGWQSQGSDGARNRQRGASRGMDFWNRTVLMDLGSTVSFFPPPGDTSPWEV